MFRNGLNNGVRLRNQKDYGGDLVPVTINCPDINESMNNLYSKLDFFVDRVFFFDDRVQKVERNVSRDVALKNGQGHARLLRSSRSRLIFFLRSPPWKACHRTSY